MKIPADSLNDGMDRLMFYEEVIRKCFYSQKSRIQQYEVLKHYWIYGCSPEGDATPYNKVEPIIDTLTAFLYSADTTRFSAHMGPETPEHAWAMARPISRAMNSEWMNCGADQIFSQALDLACVYGTELVKIVVQDKHLVPHIVDPHCFGVYREDLNGLDRQEALAHRYYISLTDLETQLKSHDKKAAILARVPGRPKQKTDEMPEGLRRIIVTNLAGIPPITPGNTVTGNAQLLLSERINYDPGISTDVVEMTELWIRDDDNKGDWQIVTMAEGPTVIYDRPNFFVNGEQPFTQVCPSPLHGYFWGMAFAGKLIGLQNWRNIRIDEIMHMLAKQAHPPTSLDGWSGMVDETSFALDRPGGVLANNDPMGKVNMHAPQVPDDIWKDIDKIDEQFMEAAALPNLLMGRGETGVRSGRQTSELSRLGSSRIKKRALAIEDNLETCATKMYKAMRKYDPDRYRTMPMGPGEKPLTFSLQQAPEDLIIKVDAHSNSPLFIEDKHALAAEMLEVHAIDRESYIEMVDPPGRDVLIRKLPAIEAKEQAAAKAAADHEEKMAAAKHAPPGAPGAGGAPARPNGAGR